MRGVQHNKYSRCEGRGIPSLLCAGLPIHYYKSFDKKLQSILNFSTLDYSITCNIPIVAMHRNPLAYVFLSFWVVFVRFRAFLNVLIGFRTFLRVFTYFSALGVPLVALRTLLGALGTLLGRSWGALGRSWALLGRSWGALGAILGALGALLGRSWAKIRKNNVWTQFLEVFLGGVLEGFWPS